MKNDASLIRDIALGDPEAMTELMDRYLPMVTRVSYRILCDIPESEKVARGVFMKVWRSAGRYDPHYSVSIWIYKMIYNLCTSHLRRLRFLALLSIHPSVYEMSAPQPLSPEEDFITKETWEVYCRASRYLSSRQRSAFVLCELEELPAADVTRIMGISSGEIRHNLLIARETVKHELSKYGKVI